ncbi:hypothetical protein ACEPAI_7194 [Sanghuangporus weigelae]
MPVEIFQEILLMTLPPTFVVAANGHDVSSLGALEDDLCMETFYLPIRISQVSRHWQRLSRSLGNLWSHLCVTLTPANFRWAQKVFDTFIERSNRSPLNFGFACDLRDVTDAQAHGAGSNIVLALLKEQQRWMDVRFKWRFLNLPATFPEIHITDTPILTSLFLETVLSKWPGEPYWSNIVENPKACSLRLLHF